MTPQHWIALAGLCLSILGAAFGVGVKLGQINMRFESFEKHLEMGSKRMDQIEKSINALAKHINGNETLLARHDDRLERLESGS